MPKKISFIGLGNFGYATFFHLDRKFKESNLNIEEKPELWGYDRKPEKVDFLNTNRCHPEFSTENKVSEICHFTGDYAELMRDCDVLVLGVTSSALEIVCQQVAPVIDRERPLHVLSVIKAILPQGQTPTQVIRNVFSQVSDNFSVSVLAGGMIASYIYQKGTLGCTIASESWQTAEILADLFEDSHLRVQKSIDILGTEYASALKSLVAIGTGIVAGSGASYGAVTHTLSKMAAECEHLSLEIGAQRETFSFGSECWGNDLIMSATGGTRNHELGELIGEGHDFAAAVQIMDERKKVVEGTKTLKVFAELPGIDLSRYPLLFCLVQMQTGQKTAADFLELLRKS